MKFDRSVAKLLANILVGLGTAKVVHDVIDNNTNPETTADKVMLYAGTAAATGVAIDAANAYTDETVDRLFDAFENRQKKS